MTTYINTWFMSGILISTGQKKNIITSQEIGLNREKGASVSRESDLSPVLQGSESDESIASARGIDQDVF